MTCSRRFGRLLQASCLGLIGALTLVGCGGSDNKPPVKYDGGTGGIDGQQSPNGVVKVTPGLIDFGTIDVGASSTAQAVTVSVTGGTAVTSATVTGPGFAISAPTTCGATQGPGAPCTVSVKFAPTTVGAASGILTIGTATVALSGTGTAPGVFALTPDRFDVGNILVNASATVVVQVVPSPSVTGLSCLPSGNLTLASQTCPATGAIATPCTFTYTFKSATAGVKNDSVVCSAAGKTAQTSVVANVVTPSSISIAPATGSFTASVGKSDTLTFSVSNNGGSTTGALAATISAGATEFAISSNGCLTPLAPLDVCKIQVTFTPTAASGATPKAATLSVADATPGSVAAVATLSGTGIAATNLAITPNPQDFGTVQIPATKAVTFTIKNSGGTPSEAITIVSSNSEFVVDASSCNGLPVAAGASCTFTTTFVPASDGAKTANIIAQSGIVAVATARVTGTAQAANTAALLAVSPPTLDFGTIGVATTKGPLALTVTNNGGTATGVLSVVKKDSTSSVGGASQFSFTSPDCNGATLAPKASCTVNVTYAPTIHGSASAILTISDGSVSSAFGTVIGIALDIPSLSVNCKPGASGVGTFESTVVGQTSGNVVCTIKNVTGVNGSTDLPQETGAITAATTGDFSIATNNCTASLQPNETCTLALVFKPTAKGARTGTLSLTTTNKAIGSADLTGTGWLPLQVDAYYTSSNGTFTKLDGTYNFGNVAMGATSDSSVTLTLAVYVHAQVGNFAISGTDLNFSNANALADFAGTPVAASTTIATLGTSAAACASLTNTKNPPYSDSPYCYVTVTFTPKSKGAKTNAITVSGADGTSSDAVNMQGTGTGPLTINPSPLTFDAVPVGTSGVQILTLTVKNAASSIGSAATIAITGTNAADFSIVTDNITNKTIPGAATPVYVPIRLTVPAGAAVGPLSAIVTVTANIAGVTETTTANLVGAAVTGAGLSATLGGSFADTVVTGTSAPVTVTVTNNGALATDVLNVKLAGGNDFAVMLTATQTSTCGDLSSALGNATTYKLDPGASCTFNVWFTPKAGLGVSKRNGTLTVSSRIGGMQVLTLTGNATGLLTITPATLDLGTTVIGDPSPAIRTFTITNNGGAQISPAVSLFNDVGQTDVGLFAIANNHCPATLGAAGSASPAPSCTVDVRLNAPAGTLPGAKSASLKVVGTVSGGGSGTSTAVMTGRAGRRATLALTPVDSSMYASLAGASASTVDRNFGNVVVGTTSAPQQFVVTNIGDFDSSALTFGFYDLAATSPYAVTTTKHAKTSDLDFTGSTCVGDGAVVKAGQSCIIQVAFHPTHCSLPYTTACPSDAAPLAVQLEVTATAGTDYSPVFTNGTLYGPRLYGNFIESNVPYIVATSNGLAPYNAGAVAATPTVTKLLLTIHNPSASAFNVPGSITVTDLYGTAALDAVGTVTLTGDTVTLLGTAPTGVTKPCTPGETTLAANANDYCVIEVDWTARATTGTREFTVAIGSASINVIGRVLTPASLVVLPVWPSALAASTTTPLDFGNPVRGVDSLTKTITIMNIGELGTTDLKVVDQGTTISGQVKVLDASTCQGNGSALATLRTCTLALAVHPADTAVAGPAPVKYIALASDVAATPASLMRVNPVIATWQAVDGAALIAGPTALSFDTAGATYPGTGVLADTTALTLTITNTSATVGTGPLNISMSSADFYIDTDTANSTCLASSLAVFGLDAVNTQAACRLKVFFSPTTLATPAKTGTLSVSSPYAATINVQMTGTAIPALTVATTSIPDPGLLTGFTANTGTFTGTTSSAAAIETFTPTPSVAASSSYLVQSFAFTKAHGAPATGLLTTSMSGTNAAEFKIIDDKCVGVSLYDVVPDNAATRSCVVTVRFAPTSAAAGKTATLTVTDPLSGTPADTISVTLRGDANP